MSQRVEVLDVRGNLICTFQKEICQSSGRSKVFFRYGRRQNGLEISSSSLEEIGAISRKFIEIFGLPRRYSLTEKLSTFANVVAYAFLRFFSPKFGMEERCRVLIGGEYPLAELSIVEDRADGQVKLALFFLMDDAVAAEFIDVESAKLLAAFAA